MKKESVGVVQTKYYNIEEPIELESGKTLDNITVAYETYGELNKEKDKLTKELARSRGMLSNEKFLNNAKPEKVQEEKDKLAKYEQMMEQVQERLAQMK